MEEEGKVCFSYGGFVRFLSVLKDRFGSAGDSILFAMSRDFGTHDIQKMLEQGAFKDAGGDEEEIFRDYLIDLERLGWGRHSLDSFDLIKGEVSVLIMSFGLAEFCEDQHSSQCIFQKGALSGILKEITEQDFYPLEAECSIDHSRCRFTFHRK